MKKLFAVTLAAVLALSLAGCSGKKSGTLVVGASPAPHAQILEVVKPLLAKEGITLEIKEFTDYVLPNTALQDGSLDANYFQHEPYLLKFNKENKTDLASAAAIHFEPLGIYAGKAASIDALANGAQIAIPNDATNGARALLLLEANGIITLKGGKGLDSTVLDIDKNPKNVKIEELEAAQIPNALGDVDLAVINGNYAIGAGIPADKVLATEDAASAAAKEFANIIAVKKGNENQPEIVALIKALQSPEVKAFIETTYAGNVKPMF
ncbi:MAG: MetQ/NlpA family ABC transporter substrate-binding protein [Oscillospiraceae bacterium]|jgi:D-methionine transport system substrate-binding protein|nr:MetQ/NlpA family ABC transporter substrate-binding protein [Oscillospiraceae bacterium]